MGSGFSKMKKQARQLEEQYEKMREEAKNAEFVGTSGNGLVTVTLNGDKEIKKLTIKPECVDPNDLEGLQDLIRAACEQAYKKIDAEQSEKGGGMGLPSGMNLPFNL
jgi:DNA-binding YbaB/EbfC family protein